MTRTEMVQALERDRTRLTAALQKIPEQTLTTRPVVETWTAKDLLGHMAMWHEAAIQFITDYRETGLPKSMGMDDDAAINAHNLRESERRRDWPLARIQAELDASYENLVAGVERLSEQDLHTPLGGVWNGETTLEQLIAENSYTHDPSHIAQIESLSS